MHNCAIFIPARLESVRFPRKPLADIHGMPMIVHVLKRAEEANIGNVYVACAEQETADIVEANGGKAVLTNPDLPSGTDRIFEAFQKLGSSYEYIINVQGDLPSLDPQIVKTSLDILLENPETDIATLAAKITDEEEINNPNVVKAVISLKDNASSGRALYFTRATAPFGEGDLYHHIGLYAYRRAALEKFESLPPSPLEKREKLEQLRALENNMRIDVGIVDTVPLGVDTKEDLAKVKQIITV